MPTNESSGIPLQMNPPGYEVQMSAHTGPMRGLCVLLLMVTTGFGVAACGGTAGTAVGVPGRTTSTTSPQSTWTTRRITTTGTVLDLAPTGQVLYWLNLVSSLSSDPMTITPTRYDLTNHALDIGTNISGLVGGPALTVTGGWVWVVFGQGLHTVAEQLDPGNLALHATHTLDESEPTPNPPSPLLTATVGGPLFVAAGVDLWALDPTSGATEYHLTTTGRIAWMSTDPAGEFLYVVSSLSNQGGEVVSQYDTGTGKLLQSTDESSAVGPGTAAATSGGVWLSFRSGMAGAAFELSSSQLHLISPVSQSCATFDQIMGGWSGVSEGVLWLTSGLGFTCADPKGGAVRASEPTHVANPIASGHVVYAEEPAGGIVAISPPSACWG